MRQRGDLLFTLPKFFQFEGQVGTQAGNQNVLLTQIFAELFVENVIEFELGQIRAFFPDIFKVRLYEEVDNLETIWRLSPEKVNLIKSIFHVLETANCPVHPLLNVVGNRAFTKSNGLLMYAPHVADIRHF